MISPFADDDPAFFEWIKKNQDGYVLNTNKTTLAKIHRATCKTFQTTENSWTKHCSLDLKELEDFVKKDPSKFLNAFGHCNICM